MVTVALGAEFARATDAQPPSLEVAARDYTHPDALDTDQPGWRNSD